MKKEKHKKTNAMRILDTHGIAYEVLEYEWEEGHGTGVHAAEALGLHTEQVFKTLVAIGTTTGPVVFCIPVAEELNLKHAARVSGNKSIDLVHVKDLEKLTGYVRGGCSPVGMKKLFPTYFHKSMQEQECIYISGGKRGMQIKVNPQKLASVVDAHFEDIIM